MLGTTQGIPVTSHPPGVQVTVDGHRRGTTPLKLRLVKNSRHTIRLDKEGYQSVVIEISGRRHPGALAPVVMDIVVGVIGGVYLGGLAGYAILGGDSGTDYQHMLLGAVVGGVALTWTFLAVDSHSKGNSLLSPEELVVTMTKIGSQAGVRYLRLDADRLDRIRWIRLTTR
jgi:hypothetical protein